MLINNIESDFLYDIIQEFGTPLYLYNCQVIKDNINQIRTNLKYKPLALHFACMSNNNIELLRLIKSQGIDIFVCTTEELYIAQKAGFKNKNIAISASNLNDYELGILVKSNGIINADSLYQFDKLIKLGLKRIGLRIAPNVKMPPSIINAAIGKESRLGIQEEDALSLINKSRHSDNLVIGLHMYIGANILDYKLYLDAIDRLISIGKQIETLEYIDIGGGFGIDYNRKKRFNWKNFDYEISTRMNELSDQLGKPIELKLEPGRCIIASAGILIARIIEIKEHNGKLFIGTDTNMSNFARPYIYNQNHEIILINNKNCNKQNTVYICGNSIAAKDFLAKKIKLPKAQVGNYIAIMDTGAYGYSMSSNFCSRLRPVEVLLKNGKAILIRERETVNDLIRKQVIKNE